MAGAVEPELRAEIKRPGAARRDELSEALLWHWAAEHNAHDWNDCGEDNDATGPGDIPCRTCAEIADMREAAAAEVERLLHKRRGVKSVILLQDNTPIVERLSSLAQYIGKLKAKKELQRKREEGDRAKRDRAALSSREQGSA